MHNTVPLGVAAGDTHQLARGINLSFATGQAFTLPATTRGRAAAGGTATAALLASPPATTPAWGATGPTPHTGSSTASPSAAQRPAAATLPLLAVLLLQPLCRLRLLVQRLHGALVVGRVGHDAARRRWRW